MSTKDNNFNVSTFLEDLKEFTGTEHLYTTVGLKFNYTDGVKYVAEACKAYWIITDIGVVVKTNLKHDEFIEISLKKTLDNAKMVYTDGNKNVLFCQNYRFTDFPLNGIKFYFINNTLLLPSEY